jgi:hypothetical protein
VRALTAIRPGIRSADLRAAAQLALSPVSPVSPMTFASPWATPAHLERVAWSDVFGTDVRQHLPLTRAEAMQVPAVARARHIIAGTLGRVELHAYRGDDRAPADPSWIAQTSGPLSPFHRHLWTADDMLFSGWSLWWRVNGADGSRCAATDCRWVSGRSTRRGTCSSTGWTATASAASTRPT